MAKTIKVRISLAWWVQPYIFAAQAFLWSVAPFLDEDDPRIAGFVERIGTFIGRHGILVSEVRS